MLILFFHGSKGINKISRRYINYLKKIENIFFEEFKSKEHNCSYGLRYISNVRNILNNEDRYMCIYDTIKKQRTKHVYSMIKKYNEPCILIGISEGAIGISGIVHPLVKSKVLIGYSGERNYFTWKENPLKGNMETHIILGEDDPFFSCKSNSVAMQVCLKSKVYPKHKIRGMSNKRNVIGYIIKNKGHNVYGKEVREILRNIIEKTRNKKYF